MSKNKFPATDLSREALGGEPLRIHGRHFIDGFGRIVQMRGMNVSGASKLPTKPNGLSHLAEGFFDHKTVSFVGRPFSLSDAPLHFARLRAWGHTLIRILVTWESISHKGPDPETDTDWDYISYLESLFQLMPEYGIKGIVCAHQDVWSRFSGGSGAPGWTFEKAGLDIEAFKATGAAFVHNLHGEGQEIPAPEHGRDEKKALGKKRKDKKKSKPEPVGAFVWPSGYQKLAASTMATLFWAGDIFAWKLRLADDIGHSDTTISLQEYLQSAYIEAFGRLADSLSQHEACLGFDVMNEPHRGLVGLKDWHSWNYETDLHIGHFPSFLQSLALGSGHEQEVPFYVKSWPFPTRVSHKSIIDPLGQSAWSKDSGMGDCIWRAHGAWQWDQTKSQPVVLRDDFFTRDPRPGKKRDTIEWYRDCYSPFIQRFIQRIRKTNPLLLCFVEPIPNEFHPPWSHQDVVSKLKEEDRLELMKASYEQNYASKTFIDTPRPPGMVYAPHFYDLNVLFSKIHNDMSVNVQGLSRGMFILNTLYFGLEGLRKNYLHQLSTLKRNGHLSFGPIATIVGEVGIPFDINGGRALGDGDYSVHEELLSALIEAMEQNELSFTLWNYNPDNKVDFGDGWNKEDFSFVCHDQTALDINNDRQDDPLYAGGRALEAIIRPYAVKVAGFPKSTLWDHEKLQFEVRFLNGGPLLDQLALSKPLDAERARTTEIYVPTYHFSTRNGDEDEVEVVIEVSDGTYQMDREKQTLYYYPSEHRLGFEHVIRIRAAPTSSPRLILKRKVGMRKRKRRLANRWPFNAQDTCTLFALLSVLILTILYVDTLFKSELMSVVREGVPEDYNV